MDLNNHLANKRKVVSEVCGQKGKLENRDCLSLVNYGIFNDIAKEVYSHGVIAGPERFNEDYQCNFIESNIHHILAIRLPRVS